MEEQVARAALAMVQPTTGSGLSTGGFPLFGRVDEDARCPGCLHQMAGILSAARKIGA